MKNLLIIICVLFSATATAWISEEIDDHASTRCVGENFELTTEGEQVYATGIALDGKKIELNGELISLTIDTDDSSLYYKVALDRQNVGGFRYLTIKSIDGTSTVVVHYNISTVAGVIGEAVCLTDWKSEEG